MNQPQINPLGILLYAITLLLYTPYFLFAARRGYYYRFPLVFYTFLGMYVYNALGSVYVYVPEAFQSRASGTEFSWEFFALLNLQVLIFYLLTLPYTELSRPFERAPGLVRSNTTVVLVSLFIATAGIIVFYVKTVGLPPGLFALGDVYEKRDIIDYRVQNTYELPNYNIFNLGFTVLPIIAAGYAYVTFLRNPAQKMLLLFIGACAFVSTFPGGKGNITSIAFVLLITTVMYRRHFEIAGPRRTRAWQLPLIVVIVTTVVVIFMYRLYYGDTQNSRDIVDAVAYKVFAGVPETIAAIITYCRRYGYLGGATLSNIHGLLPHAVFDMNRELHLYMWGPGGLAAYPAVSEGYMNYGWSGFCVACGVTYGLVILTERVFRRLCRTELAYSLFVLYCLFCLNTSQLALSATLVSLTYVVTFAALLFVDHLTARRSEGRRLA